MMTNKLDGILKDLKSKYMTVPFTSGIQIKIQDGPIGEVGKNGEQIEILGEIWLKILQHFNRKYPCRENSITITKIEEALMWQEKRTKDRTLRGVEGFNKP